MSEKMNHLIIMLDLFLRKIHFGERTHKCELCNKSFLENKLLIQHNVNVHCSR